MTVMAPDRLALPPPLRLDLVDDERAVGWIDDNEIAFRGFADEPEAAHAAWIAYRTIARRRARTHGTRPIPIDVEPLALQRVGDSEAIVASTRRIATLLRPDAENRNGEDAFGFVIALPEPTSELEARKLADLAYRTVRKSGVRWALWRRNAAPQVAPMARRNAAPEPDARAERAAAKRDGGRRRRPLRWSLPNFAPGPAPAILRW
jgi:hypothetical protein